jgi:hypothetical protein
VVTLGLCLEEILKVELTSFINEDVAFVSLSFYDTFEAQGCKCLKKNAGTISKFWAP